MSRARVVMVQWQRRGMLVYRGYKVALGDSFMGHEYRCWYCR